MAASRVARFMGVGVVSTLAYALLYLLLRGPVGADWANGLALALTAVGNTAANRRLTFGVRGRHDLVRHHVRGAARVRAHAGADVRRAGVLHGLDAPPARAVELGRARRREPRRHRHPLRRACARGSSPAAAATTPPRS